MTYSNEIIRLITEIAYCRDFRYANCRGTLLDFECAILEPLIVAETEIGPEVEIGNDWLRRYMTGSWRKTDGHYFYTMPRPERLEMVTRYLKEQGLLVPAMLREHTGTISEAWRIRDARGYRLSDNRILGGTFRGVYSGSACTAGGQNETFLLSCFVPGEDLFRIRLVWANDSAGIAVTDAFASFGTEDGRIFCRGDGGADLALDRYRFISKGRRVSEFTLGSSDQTGEQIRLELCRKPEQINRMLSLFRR